MDVNLYAAKTQLSRLVDRAAAGEEVIITRHGRPIAKLVAIETESHQRKLGQLRGKIEIAEDFDASLPDELLKSFEGES